MRHLIDLLQQLARIAAIDSALAAGESRAYDKAAVLVQEQTGQLTAVPEPTVPVPPQAAESPQPPPAQRRRNGKAGQSHRPTLAPTYDFLREKGGWTTEPEIVMALKARGTEPLPRTLRRVLADGVKSGQLERRGDSYRVAPLNP